MIYWDSYSERKKILDKAYVRYIPTYYSYEFYSHSSYIDFHVTKINGQKYIAGFIIVL